MGFLFSKKKIEKPKLFSILAVGNTVIGKTALVKCYESICKREQIKRGEIENKDDEADNGKGKTLSTISMDHSVVKCMVKGKKGKDILLTVKIWDSPGQERFESMVLSSMRTTNGIFLVYDITSRTSFNDLNKWIDNVKKCQTLSEFPFIIISNKIDLDKQRDVTVEEGKKYAEENGLPFYETSALTEEGVEKAFLGLIQRVYNKNYNISNGNIVL